MPDTTKNIAEKVFNGEYSSVDDLKMAVKLLLNASGTDMQEIRDKMKDLVNYCTLKKDINEVEYIPVETVLDIISNTE